MLNGSIQDAYRPVNGREMHTIRRQYELYLENGDKRVKNGQDVSIVVTLDGCSGLNRLDGVKLSGFIFSPESQSD